MYLLLGVLGRKHFTFEWQARGYKFTSCCILIINSIWLVDKPLRDDQDM